MTLKSIYRKDFKNLPPLVCEDGQIKPNPFLINTYPYSLTLDDINNDSVVTIPASSTMRRGMTNDKSGTIDIRTFKHVATSSSYMANILDVQNNRYLMNRAIHADTIFGDGGDPFELPIPLILYPTQSLIFDLQDLSGAPNIVRFSLEGHRYYFNAFDKIFADAGEANRISRPYFYTTDDSVQLPAAATQLSVNMTFVGDADFYLHRITTHQTGAFRVKITNLSTGLAMSNGWIHSSVFGGDSRNYYDLEPMLIRRRTSLKFDFINMTSPLALNDIYITFCGVNYYYQD